MKSTTGANDVEAVAPSTVSSTEHEKEQTEEAVVSALATLGDAASKIDEEENEEFEIPQRFTKSGRKRAIPFPLKVSYLTPARLRSSLDDAVQIFSGCLGCA